MQQRRRVGTASLCANSDERWEGLCHVVLIGWALPPPPPPQSTLWENRLSRGRGRTLGEMPSQSSDSKKISMPRKDPICAARRRGPQRQKTIDQQRWAEERM